MPSMGIQGWNDSEVRSAALVWSYSFPEKRDFIDAENDSMCHVVTAICVAKALTQYVVEVAFAILAGMTYAVFVRFLCKRLSALTENAPFSVFPHQGLIFGDATETGV
jgi:hypothetical protein